MSNLSMTDKRKLQDAFWYNSGWVLDYSNRTFSELFRTVANIDIYNEKYGKYGDSKGKRLSAFLEIEEDKVVGKVLSELVLYWNYVKKDIDPELKSEQKRHLDEIVNRLLGKSHGDFNSKEITEDEFLKVEFEKLSLKNIEIEPSVISILESRLNEAIQCRKSNASLACIFMCGSILEGLLLGAAIKNPKNFNQATSSPKKEGQAKKFQDWKLGEFIDVAYEIGILQLDVKKFSHVLRDFRNYIHPYEQLASTFHPNEHTADICLQVLKASIFSLSSKK